MAKGARSNHKKAVRTQRRLTLKATWQEEADARRYAALAEAASAVSLPVILHPGNDMDQDQEASRGREKPAKRGAGASDAMQTDVVRAPQAGKKKKGFKVNGVQKKTHNSKKTSPLWVRTKQHAGSFGFTFGCPPLFPFDILIASDVITPHSHTLWLQASNFHKSKRGKEGHQ